MWNDLTKSNYLGLPSLIGRLKKAVFKFVKEKVEKKIKSWNAKILSRAGKAILIKSVAQTIPVYMMSCFMLPKSLCKEMEVLMNKIWWKSGTDNNKGVNWLS